MIGMVGIINVRSRPARSAAVDMWQPTRGRIHARQARPSHWSMPSLIEHASPNPPRSDPKVSLDRPASRQYRGELWCVVTVPVNVDDGVCRAIPGSPGRETRAAPTAPTSRCAGSPGITRTPPDFPSRVVAQPNSQQNMSANRMMPVPLDVDTCCPSCPA